MIRGNNIFALVTGGVLYDTEPDARAVDLTQGQTAAIEQAMVEQLAALNLNNEKVFKTSKLWKHQISAGAGGAEAFDKYAPFAFVRFQPTTETNRQGDGDLCQQLRFAVGIGFKSKTAGEARTAASKARDLIIDLFDRWHPGEGFECNDLYFDGDEVNFDSPCRHGIVIFFKTSLMI